MTTTKSFRAAALVLGMALAGSAWAGPAAKPAPFKPVKPYVEGEIVVQFAAAVDSPEAMAANAKGGGTVLKVQKKGHLALIQLPPKMDTIKAVELYRKIPGVVTAEPNYVVTPIAHNSAKKSPPKKK